MGFCPFSGLFWAGKTFAYAADALQFPIGVMLPNADFAAPAVMPLVFDAVLEAFGTGIVINTSPDMLFHLTPPTHRRNPSLPVGRFHPTHHVLSFHFLTFSKISSRVGAPDKAVSWCSIFSCSFLLGRQRRTCSAQHTGQRKFSTEPVGGQQGQVLDVKRVIFHLLLNLCWGFPRIGLIHKTLISSLPANND